MSTHRSYRPRIEFLEDRRLLDGMPAFPGAEGFGALATGGRGGSIYHVTNLNDSGAGSFRDAVSHGNRIVVFDIGGNIDLRSAVSVASNLTIAGQTAPGDGIAIEGREISFSSHSNIIVRYLRFRQGSPDPDSSKSAVNMANSHNIILDHVSIEFGKWDNLDAVGASNITVENSIIADPIGQQFNAHTEGSNFTWYNDVFSSAHNRSPLAKANTQFVDNVVYNFQAGYTVANTSGHFSHDIVNNYFITGPSTTNASNAFYQMNTGQSVYADGNYEDSNRNGRLDGSPVSPGSVTHLSAPWSATTYDLPTLSAADAYYYDVAVAGASLHRDSVDAQVIGDVLSLGHSGRLWTSQTQTGLPNNGFGILNGGPTIVDSDGDGMPDGWELYYGLDPTQNNANGDFDGTGYTNIEKYVNGIVDGSYGWLPAPWPVGDVGSVGVGGSANFFADGSFSVSGSGAGIGGTNDQFTFVSQGVSGDGSITALVNSQTNTNNRAEAGVMFRNSTDDTAAYAEVHVTPDGHVFFTWRANDGGSSSYATAHAHTPVWVQLARMGNSFTGSYSLDGANWSTIATHTANLSPDDLVGMVVSSHDNTTVSTAAFANVSTSWAGPSPHTVSGLAAATLPDAALASAFTGTGSSSNIAAMSSGGDEVKNPAAQTSTALPVTADFNSDTLATWSSTSDFSMPSVIATSSLCGDTSIVDTVFAADALGGVIC
jgi:hypothetical protein